MSKLFGTALFGYRKKDVVAYIEQISKSFEEKTREFEDTLECLRKEKEEALQEKLRLEAQKQLIADALTDAQEKAQEVIDQAQKKAARELEAAQRKITAENERLSAVRREISAVRRSALDTVDRISKNLEALAEESV